MNPWTILGINPTAEIKLIKSAYAEKSKLYHPEDKPEEFQKIHEAYREALKLAKSIPEHKSSKQRIKPPAVKFKRSFYVHKPYDNPARAKFYKSEFDEYAEGQLKKIKYENHKFGRSKRKADSLADIGEIPIKGAEKKESKLDFTALEHNISADEIIL